MAAVITTPTKTAQTDLFAWANIASGTDSIGTAFDCSAVFAASFHVKLGRLTSTAFTAGYPNIEIQVSTATTGLDNWATIYAFQPTIGATISATTGSASFAAGATTFTVTSATNIAANDKLFLGDSSTANYELADVLSVSSTTVTLNQAVVYNHATTQLVSDQAEQATPQLDLSSYMRVRARVNNNGSGQGIKAQVKMTTLTNLSSI